MQRSEFAEGPIVWTMFMGIAPDDQHPPELFVTIIECVPWMLEHRRTERYFTEEQAKDGHASAVELVRRELDKRQRGGEPGSLPEKPVHILWHGLPMCGFSNALPCDWPKGHTWVHRGVPWATCEDCLAAEKQREK